MLTNCEVLRFMKIPITKRSFAIARRSYNRGMIGRGRPVKFDPFMAQPLSRTVKGQGVYFTARSSADCITNMSF